MNSTEFQALIDRYKSEIKATRIERPLTAEEMENIGSSILDLPDEYRVNYHDAAHGNFEKFEKLPHLLRNYLGALQWQNLEHAIGTNFSLENEGTRRYLEGRAMNAAFRSGVSMMKNAEGEQKRIAEAVDTYMNAYLMKQTMMPTTETARTALTRELGEEQATVAIEQNRAKQLVMAKTMLLAQLGKYDVINKNNLNHELNVPVSETLAHGGRTNFVLPAGENSKRVLDAFMGANRGAAAGIEKRTAATHAVKLRTIGSNGMIRSDTKETKTFSPLKVFSNQYGMNIAVGGLGATGPDQKVITGNGEAGHVYMRAQKGDAKTCASLMIGIEGSEPGKSNYLGNDHGIRAKSAKQSAFLADKGIVGKKIGGRQVDLSGLSVDDLSGLLDRFSEEYSRLQQEATTPETIEKLAQINDMLMGKHMEPDKLMEMFHGLGMADEATRDIVSRARQGYISGVSPDNFSANQFTQAIRSKFSQDKACRIAEARVAYAGDNLDLAVGAVKELMLTHETRKLGWKLRHPILNYREKSTISNLLGQLHDRGLSAEQISERLQSNTDTFSMDWGDELSYDRDVRQFVKSNENSFRPSDNKLSNAIHKACRDYLKEFSANEKVVNEAPKIQNEPRPGMRESLSVVEENERNKNMPIQPRIESPQPTMSRERNKDR